MSTQRAPDDLRRFASDVHSLGEALRARHAWLATAESCTGGLIAAACTSVAGSSEWFDRGFVTYSNAAKIETLGVDAALIERHGAVSQPVARAMAHGALARSHATIALAVTGVAGPGGATPGKPVGTVWLAWALQGDGGDERLQLPGDRADVRAATVEAALRRVLELARHLAPMA